MALTDFGKLVRKARIDADVTLGQMSDELRVTPAFLSGLETGRKKVPAEWVPKIEHYFQARGVKVQLRVAADLANESVSLEGLTPEHKLLVAGFARGRFSKEEMERMKRLFGEIGGGQE